MPTTRPQIIRRILWAPAVVVVVPMWYVGSVATIHFMDAAGWMPRSCIGPAEAYIYPAHRYMLHELPGASCCIAVVNWAADCGYAMRRIRLQQQLDEQLHRVEESH